jgi:hypothetical protein
MHGRGETKRVRLSFGREIYLMHIGYNPRVVHPNYHSAEVKRGSS